MEIGAAFSNPMTILIFLIGSGGITTLLTAWIGWRRQTQRDDKDKSSGLVVADRLAFERLTVQVERCGDLIEKAIDRSEMFKMIEGLRSTSK